MLKISNPPQSPFRKGGFKYAFEINEIYPLFSKEGEGEITE